MTLTREQLADMDEEQLRTQVLIPLFKKMGFRDVYPYHGGPLEQGKDIVMWKPGDIRERVNYGVVVKAERISGKASGKSSAAQVRFQIEQCFGKTYPDPVTTEEQKVDRCFVVSSKEIIKEALYAIQGVLRDNNLDKVTDFIGGDKLWELIEKYLPERTVWEKLQQVQKVFHEASPYYRIVTQTKEDGVAISLEPKYPGAEQEHPVTFSGRFVFPDTPEGQGMREAFEQHLKTGAPVTLTKLYIEEFKLPEFLIPFLDPTGEGIGMLAIGPRRLPHPLLVKLEAECEDGERAALEYIHLNSMQAGMEEMTFANDQQPVPWKLQLVLNVKEKRMHFRYTANFMGVNVKRVLEALRFQQAMAKGGVFKMEHLDTGFELAKMPIAPGVLEVPDPHWIELVEKLVFIQSKVHIPLVIPDREVTIEDARRIFATAQKLETGQAKLGAEEWAIGVTRESAQTMLELFESGKPLPFRLAADETEEIFGVTIPLGPVILTCKEAYVAEEDLNALRAAIATTTLGETVPIRFKPFEGCPIQAEYPNWLPSGDQALGPLDGNVLEPDRDKAPAP
jgi:hypothetical protein